MNGKLIQIILWPILAAILLYTCVFFISQSLPDIATTKAGLLGRNSPLVEHYNQKFELDDSMFQRYFNGLYSYVTFQWGDAWDTGFDIKNRVAHDLSATVSRMFLILALALIIGFFLSLFAEKVRFLSVCYDLSSNLPSFVIWFMSVSLVSSTKLGEYIIPTPQELLYFSMIVPMSFFMAVLMGLIRKKHKSSLYFLAMNSFGIGSIRRKFIFLKVLALNITPQLPIIYMTGLLVIIIPEAISSEYGLGNTLVRAVFMGDIPVLLAYTLTIAIVVSICQALSHVLRSMIRAKV